MDDMSLVYNIKLCRICQIPDYLDVVSTSNLNTEGQSYFDLLNFIFNDIPWVEDSITSLACQTCIKRIKDTAEFKTICLESNQRRGALNAALVKLETETITNGVEEYNMDEPDFETMADEETSSVKLEKNGLPNENKQFQIKAKRKKKETIRKLRSPPKQDFSDKDELTNLRKRKSQTMNHQCNICPMEFRNLEEYDRHIYKHNGTRNYICTVCGRTYITRDDLKQHSYRHNTEAKYACPTCPNKKYKTARDLRTHKKIVHTDREHYKYLCTECGMKFPQLCALKTHIVRRHSKIRQFKCDMCDKSFAEKRDLQHHYLTHTNVRAFKCDLCPSEYKRKDVLLNHKTKHHGIGNYKFHVDKKLDCSYCGKKITKDKLKRHIRTHTGVKPFNCRLCDMKFICNSYIKGHLKAKHETDIDASDFDTKLYYDVCEEDPPLQISCVVANATNTTEDLAL